MPPNERPVYNLKTLHLVFAVSSLVLLATVVWVIALEYDRPWRAYQRRTLQAIDPWITRARIEQRRIDQQMAVDEVGSRGGPSLDDLRRTLDRQTAWVGRGLAVRQTSLPGLPVDLSFHDIPRVDRCETCHTGIDRGWSEFVPTSLLEGEGRASGRGAPRLPSPSPAATASDPPASGRVTRPAQNAFPRCFPNMA